MPAVQYPHWRPCFIPERLLDRVQLAALGEPFDGRDVAAVGLHRQTGAGLYGDAVHPDHTGAALAGVAPDLGAGEAQVIPQEMDQQHPRVHVALAGPAIDSDLNSQGDTPVG